MILARMGNSVKEKTALRLFKLCPGTDLNRYLHCCKQDFKSCVSTNFTTRAAKMNACNWTKTANAALQKKSSAREEV